ncbi:unnamed protein product, partial [marine sediment metagenome]
DYYVVNVAIVKNQKTNMNIVSSRAVRQAAADAGICARDPTLEAVHMQVASWLLLVPPVMCANPLEVQV